MPLVPVLADMEMEGVALDVGFLRRMSAELNERLIEIEDQIYQAVGDPFNLNSPQQLSMALFDRLKIPPPDRTQRTASGHYSTSADVLGETAGAASGCGFGAGVSRAIQTQIHLPGCAARAGEPTDRAGAHFLQPDGFGHRAGWLHRIRTCRISQSGPRSAAGCEMPLSPCRGTTCWGWITPRLSCGSLPTWRMTRRCWTHSGGAGYPCGNCGGDLRDPA